MYRSFSEKVSATDEFEYRVRRAKRQIVAEHKIVVMTNGGDFSAFIRDREIDFSPVEKESTLTVTL